MQWRKKANLQHANVHRTVCRVISELENKKKEEDQKSPVKKKMREDEEEDEEEEDDDDDEDNDEEKETQKEVHVWSLTRPGDSE